MYSLVNKITHIYNFGPSTMAVCEWWTDKACPHAESIHNDVPREPEGSHRMINEHAPADFFWPSKTFLFYPPHITTEANACLGTTIVIHPLYPEHCNTRVKYFMSVLASDQVVCVWNSAAPYMARPHPSELQASATPGAIQEDNWAAANLLRIDRFVVMAHCDIEEILAPSVCDKFIMRN